jgi:hypothetical protein
MPACSALARSILPLKTEIVMIRTPAALSLRKRSAASGHGFKVK